MVIQLPPAAIYVAHAAFWISFILTRVFVRTRDEAPVTSNPGPSQKSRGAGLLVGLHGFAFAVLYNGIFIGVLKRFPTLFSSMPIFGALFILCAMLLGSWSLLHFRSWRFKAQIDGGHQLASSGPFSIVRHPIYLALSLLALGSVLWIPNTVTLCGFVLIVIFSDLRGRAEEALLERVFPTEYVAYKKKVARLVPGVY